MMTFYLVFCCLMWRIGHSCTNSKGDGESTPKEYEDGDKPGLFAPEHQEPPDDSQPGVPPAGPTPNKEKVASMFVSKNVSAPLFVIAFDKAEQSKRSSLTRDTVVIRASDASYDNWHCNKKRILETKHPVWSNPSSQGALVMGHDKSNSFLVACGVKLKNGKTGCQKNSQNNWIDISAPFPKELLSSDDKVNELTIVFTYMGIWSAKNLQNTKDESWMLNLISEEWVQSIFLPDIRSDYCVVPNYGKNEDYLMILGGLDETKADLKSVYQWTWDSDMNKKWKSRPKMLDARHGMACGWNDKDIYVVGGFVKKEYVDKKTNVMILDLISDKWNYGIPLELNSNFKGLNHRHIYFMFGRPLIIWQKKFLIFNIKQDKWEYLEEEMFPPFNHENSTMTEVVGHFISDTCEEWGSVDPYMLTQNMFNPDITEDPSAKEVTEPEICVLYPCGEYLDDNLRN